MLRAAVVAATVPTALVLLVGTALAVDGDAAAAGSTTASVPTAGINEAALPPLARRMLPVVEEILDRDPLGCHELPPVWVLAETQAESGWNPEAFSVAGAAGLLQMMPGTWVTAGGSGGAWSTSSRPPASHPVWEPTAHLTVALAWMCSNLRLVTAHLQATRKPTSRLDALAVCHIAGCSRVTGSRTGVPAAGEAGCGAGCVRQVTVYIAAIHRYVQAYAAPAPVAAGSSQPYQGGATGCAVPDPSGTGGCVTGALAWLMDQVQRRFGPWPVACWSGRGGDPYSDHPLGKACDYTVGRIGIYPNAQQVAHGWALASCLRANAVALHVAYVIWQGRVWSRSHDREGWRPYNGGGVYDPAGPTGGHYDHVHVSTTD